jgi:hypothetical protein
MMEPDLVLEFEIEPGRSPNLENVGRALLAWNDAVQVAVRAIDPGAEVIVELVDVEHGSQRFKQIFRRAEKFAHTVEQGGQDYPLVWKHTKALAKCVAGGILVAGIGVALTPDPQLPEEQMEVFRDIRDLLREDMDLKRSSQTFYEILQEEPSFRQVEVFEGNSKEPFYTVPRSEFAHKSGLFDPQEEDETIETTRPRVVTWEVILVRPVLVGKPRRWTFARDGIEFSALMTDKAVLQALHDKTLAIPFAEGVMMQIEVTYKERFDGKVWLPDADSRKVTRVLSPRVPVSLAPLFAGADRP